jgi:hypothetical protein
MVLLLRRRPISERRRLVWFPSWQRNLKRSPAGERSLAPRSPRRRANFRPQAETLDERCLLSFSSPIATSVIQPVAIVTADVNNDGKADVIAATPVNGGITVMLGLGNGRFATPTYWSASGTDTPKTLAVADVNGDGKLDIVTGNDPGDGAAFGEKASISVLLGDGEGHFPTVQTYSGFSFVTPTSIAVSDVNGDGRPDIILAGYGPSVDVMMNVGVGATQWPVQSYNPAGVDSTGAPIMVAAGDVNGDAKPDIVLTWGTQVEALLNTGTGTFVATQPYDVGADPLSVTLGDVNGDGNLDIVTANAYYPPGSGVPLGTVSVLLGHGDGTFGATQTYAIGGEPNSIALGDFNEDGKLDIVTTGSEMDMLLNNGDGTFGAYQKVGPAGSSVVVADFNNDGLLDIAQIDGLGTSVDVLLNGVKSKGKGKK